MIDANAVFSLFCQRYGDTSPDDDVKAFCFTASRELEPLLKDGCDRGDIRVLGAVAALAALRMRKKAYTLDDSPASFKAGDMSVSFSPAQALREAEAEYSQAIEALAPLMKDISFFFGQVKI